MSGLLSFRFLPYFSCWLIICLFSGGISGQTTLEIWQIQGAGAESPYRDSLIKAPRNIVTLVTDDRFFIQTPPERSDNDTLTSDGIMIYTGTETGLAVGDLVTVTGRIQEYFGLTEFGPDNVQVSIDSSNVALPEIVYLNENLPGKEALPLPLLEQLEGMRVAMENGIVTGPTDNDGVLHASLVPPAERPFREPGIRYPGQSGLPLWDGNPEVIQINLQWAGFSNLFSLDPISASGVLSFSNGTYQLIASSYESDSQASVRSVSAPAANQATIASLNCFLLFQNEPEYPSRRFKLARYIGEVLQAPDILAVQEVQSLNVLKDIANAVQEQYPDLIYTAYLETGSSSFPIHLGYLVKNTVINPEVIQLGAEENSSLGGRLHDRPPLLLEAEFNTSPPTPIRVLNLHLRSLNGIEGSDSIQVRTKRFEQSISVGNMIQDLQNENLVVVGDMNAFQFSDGYVDVLSQLTGTPSLGAQFPPVLAVVDPPLTNQSALLAPEERYSYVYRGNAQILDHCLTNDFTDISVNHLEYARGNADAPPNLYNNSFVLWRVSDHDGFVLYLDLNDSLSVSNQNVEMLSSKLNFTNPFPSRGNIQLDLVKTQKVMLQLVDVQGQVVFHKNFGRLATGKYTLPLHLDVPAGAYWLRLAGDPNAFPIIIP